MKRLMESTLRTLNRHNLLLKRDSGLEWANQKTQEKIRKSRMNLEKNVRHICEFKRFYDTQDDAIDEKNSNSDKPHRLASQA